jgi:hypothetical protein
MKAKTPKAGRSKGLRLKASLASTVFDVIRAPIQRQALKQKFVFTTGDGARLLIPKMVKALKPISHAT